MLTLRRKKKKQKYTQQVKEKVGKVVSGHICTKEAGFEDKINQEDRPVV